MIISIGLGQIVIDLERKIEFRSRGTIFANNSSHWLVKILNFLKKDKRIFTSSVKKKKKAQYLSDFLVSEIDPGSGISDPG